jgi:triacylglycerol lipase
METTKPTQTRRARSLRLVLSALILTGLVLAVNAGVRSTPFARTYADNGGDYVVTLHGLGRTYAEMRPMATHLFRAGFTVVNVNYPSNRFGVDDLGDSLVPELVLGHCPDSTRKIHFVTHSMGGIVVRRMLSNEQIRQRTGRVVMVAPPNQGSELASRIQDNRLAQAVMGPALAAFDTSGSSYVNQLGPMSVPTLIIAGRRSYVPALSKLIPGEDDGVVAVERTRVDGMTEHMVVERSHTFIARAKEVKAAALLFLLESERQAGSR